MFEVALDRGRFVLAGPDALATLLPQAAHPQPPFGAAVGIESADLDRTRFLLANAGITVHGRPDCLLVPPSGGLGAWIDFHRPDAPPLWAT